MAGKRATFCVATYFDEDILVDTMNNLVQSVNPDEYDFIVVDDAGNLDESLLKDIPNLRIFHNPTRLGVGYSLDFGVKKAETDIVFIMGNDIRFTPGWDDRFYSIVRSNPTSIVNSVCAGLNSERKYLKGTENKYYAANVLFRVTEQNNRKVPQPYREYLEGKWNNWPKARREVCNIEQVGCLMGAFYGCHRDWFLQIRGFEGHKTWGALEPLLSIRSYMAGGDVLIDGKTVTGHLFKKVGSSKPIKNIIYNKLMIASTLLTPELEREVYAWAGRIAYGNKALAMAQQDSHLFSLLESYGRGKVKTFGRTPELDIAEMKRRLKRTGIMDSL